MLNYPPSHPDPTVVDFYHGQAVPDPYRWLEDLDSEQTRAWIEAQNRLTFDYLQRIPARQRLLERLRQLWNYEKYSQPFKEGNRYFYFKNDGLQNQSVLYTQESLEGEARVLLDPNTLSEDGTVALSGIAISRDGRYLAYGLSRSGSDWQEWKVRDIETGEDLPDHLRWIKFSGASWTLDGQGFFYSRYDEPAPGSEYESANYFQKLYYHRLGTPQSEDLLVYHRPDQKEWGFAGGVTEDGDYLIISVWRGTDPKNLLFYKDLRDPSSPVVELIREFQAEYAFVGNDGSRFWLLTDLQAPRRRLVAIDLDNPGQLQEVIPEAEETLQGVSLIHNQFVAFYLKDAHTQIRTFALDGTYLGEIPLPGLGSASGFGGKRHDTETFYTFTSFTTPPTIYRYDFTSGRSTLFRQPQVDFDPQAYEVQQVFYASQDGTRIPMFLVHRRGLARTGDHPTLLYGYGGFGISLTPSFSVGLVAWLEMGGVYAQPSLRGGGEYGEAWHQAGTKLNKQKVFDDFIAAAEWLMANGYTNPSKLAIAGGSNGGLLVGACLTQRPDLFAAALPAVGVFDMLRFHKFTIGWAWISEYGSPEDPEEFKALYAYSPLHNLKPGTAYPATLITTADHDDRVVPAHSFKFAAALQAAQGGSQPILIRIDTKAGHGAGKPTAKLIEETADRWAFLVQVLGIQAG
ncbi:prolyl oligopeptidase [Thermostichus sp. MS-CIW-21]|jgi:prolyl oligopeptidase|uniref:prolyl oligopeptidase family serine peptidase n=1 Tax=unclassified Synechococcus TaxID=2626047 RepID=UPI0000694827|nr:MULTISPECIES: prolyl oligopeptidase family serine peptidase [unclassified Synechococcus]ABD00673.1 prolyl oligopeptidase [Synechococcus sp. JA-3-3Ab]PIK86507.1 prolyl endopeptidase [Synechococcus sp. 63AY4M2]PIK91870.1 prolyl endopeptidase [Synechococcus sp. 65AY6Li]PIK97817.1 prolyl endopeptidase [Synechococcus sp. 63AY4M1]PIL01461.1 prolyl endopeptidase [Synechococcus sp. 65AY640]